EPDLRLVSRTVVPKDFPLVTRTGVAGSNDAPRRPNEGRIAVLADHGSSASHPVEGCPLAHEPNLRLVRRTVVPNDIWNPVFFKVASSNNAPWRPNEGRVPVLAENCRPASQSVPVHEPDLRLVSRAVVPNDFRLGIPIGAAGSNDAPWRP